MKYLGVAVAVALSTISSPFLISNSINTNYIPYLLGTGYTLIVSGVGFAEYSSERKRKMEMENPRKFCNGNRRIPIEELVSLDE